MAQAETQEPGEEPVAVFDVVHAHLLRYFPDLVDSLGGDARYLMQEAGLSPDLLAYGKVGASYRQMIQLIEQAALALDCPDFGMRLATLQGGITIFGPLGLVMQNSTTFGQALDYVISHSFAHSLATRIWLQPCPEEQSIFVGHDILFDRLPNRSQTMEQLMLVGHLAAMEITGGHVRVRRVHFRHQPISPLKTYRRYFGCEVRFGQNENGVFYSEQDWSCPIVAPDSGTYQAITSFIDTHFTRQPPPLHAQVRGVIMQFLGGEHCTNERISAELKLHPRTLHRRLKEEGTSFQLIKDEVRRDVMLYYLQQTNLDFALISERLGFSEQSVMTRSCNRWFATSPSGLRAQARPR